MRLRKYSLGALLLLGVPVAGRAQASALPSAQSGGSLPGQSADASERGHKLLDAMVQALGGDAWLNRKDMVLQGKAASFYKGQPNTNVAQFEDYRRFAPFGERTIIVTKLGNLIATNHRDVADVWTADGGFEITYRGKKPIPAKDVEDFQRRRAHAVEVVVKDWLHQPGVLVTYEGTSMVSRRLADQVTVLTASNDAVTLQLDASSHLPLSRSFQWRDPIYKDLDTDVEQYDAWQPFSGIMTPMNITRLQNGDMVSQRFFTKVAYNVDLPADLFDPDRPLDKKK